MIIVDLWRRMEGAFFCISTKSSSGKWSDNYFPRNQLDKVRQFIKDNADKDIYFCPHGLKSKSRKEEAAVLPKMLWADLDEADPRHIKPKPTIAFESSPGRFVGLWLTDKPVTKELNRALTYKVDADKSGWDLGQVLRVPGTTNYKYPTQPRVRVMWDDQPPVSISQVEKAVGEYLKKESGDASSLVASDVYRRYQRKMPVWLRKELLRQDKPAAGKRSEMIWKIEHALIECGCDQDEAFVLLKASVWNKFKGRHNEDEQLSRELEKVIDGRLDARSDGIVAPVKSYKFLANPLSEVEERNIDWMWHGRFAFGELTIVEGDPGVGKSFFVQRLCKAACDGELLPGMDKRDRLSPSKVAYFDIENDGSAVTKPRMIDNEIQNPQNFFQEEMPFSIDDEDALEAVEEAIGRLKPKVIVFDTLNNYIGSADTHKASEAQQSMMWFRNIARRHHCCVIVVRHLTKGGKDKALYRGQGSIAFAGAARIVISIGYHPDNSEIRVAAVTKLNLAKFPRALTYQLVSLPEKDGRRDRARIEFGELCDLTADDILNAPQSSEKSNDLEDAMEFLRTVLGDGELETRKVETMAEKRSISKRTLARAAEALKVTKSRQGFGKKATFYWSLTEE